MLDNEFITDSTELSLTSLVKNRRKKNQCKERKIISTVCRDCSVSWQVFVAQSTSELDRFALNSL